MIIDTHTHFYDTERPEGVPWPKKDSKLLYRPVMPEEFIALTKPLGVTGTVVVEASSWISDNQWILDLAEDYKFIKGLVGRLDPGNQAFKEHIAELGKKKLFLGIRIRSTDLAKNLADKDFTKDLARLLDHDLSLDILVRPVESLKSIVTLSKKLPKLRIVINHLGNIRKKDKDEALNPVWVEGIKAVAACENVNMKFSGLVETTGKTDGSAPTDLAFYKPIFDEVFNAFGEDRLIFGSNWLVCTRAGSYETVLNLAKTYLKEKGDAATQKVFWKNAKAVYRYQDRP